MDPQIFAQSLKREAALYIAKLFDLPDLPRSRVHDITNGFTQFLNNSPITILFMHLLNSLEFLNESPNNLLAMKTMLALILNPFEELRTEHQCLQHFEDTDTYIPPIEVVVGTKKRYKNIKDEIISTNENITVQVIPLQQVLQKFFELPNVFELTLTYISNLENEKILYSNIIQGLKWREKKNFGERIVFPILFYQDDYETNNPLGSRKGLGKLGTVYIIIPCLPPSLRSKVENIFLLSLHKCDDLQYVTLKTMLSRAIVELKSLESTGITIRTSSGQHQIYFSLAGVIGDNLAIHSMLGFCLINRADINSTFDESDCILRTDENYKND
ncbi:GSCOCG00011948001-RA-CDS [Cotesia congregata]|nr:GSCOCG00011948001-RA-CDS [Cotesia congregata]